MPGGYTPYFKDDKSGYTVVVTCQHGVEHRCDLAYVKRPKRLRDDCPMARLEREVESMEHQFSRRLKRLLRGLPEDPGKRNT